MTRLQSDVTVWGFWIRRVGNPLFVLTISLQSSYPRARGILTDKISYGGVTTMTDTTKGIKVIWPARWPPERRRGVATEEIEYFYGINVNQLDDIPEFTKVKAFCPQDNPELPNWPKWVEYVVRCERNPSNENEVRLAVTYDQGKNPEIVRIYREHEFDDIAGLWGTNTIVLTQGMQCGHYEWLGDTSPEDIVCGLWESFDLGAGRARRPRTTTRTRREAAFRDMILAAADRRCVLTEEATIKALDAAHLIPAATGENDEPPNGITLRADLHRLFDANLFTFDPDGQVAIRNARELSATYRRCLRNRCLPPPTLERVRATLALPQFQNRPPAR